MYPNPRFPHTCRIYRCIGGGDAFSQTEEEEVYSGECRSYPTTRNTGNERVVSSQLTLSIPAYRKLEDGTLERINVKCFAGDKVSCTDARGKELNGTVVDCYMGTLGTNVYWNYNAN